MNKNYVRFSNEQIAYLGTTNEGLEVILNNCNGLVYRIAKKTYMEGYELEEKANICRMGLVKAVRQFDLEKANAAGGDFYTFANKVVTSFIYQEASKLKAGKRGYNKEEGTSTKVYSLEYTRDTELLSLLFKEKKLSAKQLNEFYVRLPLEANATKWAIDFAMQNKKFCKYYQNKIGKEISK